MAVEIWWISGSPYAWAVLLALELKSIDYASHLLLVSRGDHKRPEFLALNPRGLAPVLRDGAVVLPESVAILAYLEAKFPSPALFGATPGETGRVWKVVQDCHNYLKPAVDRVVNPVFEPHIYGAVEEKADDMRQAAGIVARELGCLDAALAGRGWLVGGGITAADIVAFPFVLLYERGLAQEAMAPLGLEAGPLAGRYPALGAWLKRIAALEAFEKTYPPHWREAA